MTTGGTPAQLCTFPPAPASPVTAKDPSRPPPAPASGARDPVIATPRQRLRSGRMKSNLPFGSGDLGRLASTAHLPHVSALSRPGTRPGTGELCSAPAGEPGVTALVSRRLSAAGICSRASCPARGFCPSAIGLPRRLRRRGPGQGPMFRTREVRPGPGALCTPGTAVPARPRMHPVTAACRLATAGPCHPGTTVRPGMFFSRGISKGSLAFAPPGLPLACDPRTERGLLGFTPGFTPGWAGPSRACRGGTGLRHWPGVTSPPSSAASFLDAPTHYERHHVAMHGEERSGLEVAACGNR